MKYWMLFTGLIFLTACDSEVANNEVPDPPKNKEVSTRDLDSKVAAHIKGQLKLTAIDKFDSTWYSQDITGDDVDDYIITVNLLDRAINDAIAQDKVDKMKEVGYMGYFNHFFFVDGATEEISNSIVVPSSPMFKLQVVFQEILGSGQTDFYVDYRVRNMQRRKFFTFFKGQTKEVYQGVVFDGLGTSNTEAYEIRLEEGTKNDFNDIVEYEAKLEEIIIPNIDSTYSYNPTITPTDKVVRRWHFSPSQGKYYTVPE